MKDQISISAIGEYGHAEFIPDRIVEALNKSIRLHMEAYGLTDVTVVSVNKGRPIDIPIPK